MSETNSQFPGVFRGNSRLASQHDVQALKQYVERLIAGPINELNEDGYIPWKYTADGALDIEYLFPELIHKFEEQTGITIKNDGVKFLDSVTSINFQGKYVTLDVDETGSLVCIIDEPTIKIPNFNEANPFGEALVKIENSIIENMIVPDTSKLTTTSVYGDWEPGKKVPGINWNKSTQYDILKLTTNGPVFASNLSTYFEVIITDGNGSKFATFISSPIASNTKKWEPLAAASMQNSPYIEIFIDDMKEEPKGYSFIPRFEINLIKILGSTAGRFNVMIIHHNASVAYKYISQDLLYNYGRIPMMSTSSIRLLEDDSVPNNERLTFTVCSGLKYVKNGVVFVKLNKIHDLNFMAAVDNPIDYSFNIANSETELIAEDYNYELDKVATYQIKLKLNDNTLNNKAVSGSVVLSNAFGSSNPNLISLPVLLNSQNDLKVSTDLAEYFTDELFRVLSTFDVDPSILGDYSNFIAWDSTKSLIDYDEGRGLLVVPGVGLCYPFGNWSDFLPMNNPNYSLISFLSNEKYFARIFSGNFKVKFGGVFKFEGLTKDDFNDSRLSVLISCDQGRSWLNLKTIRNMESTVLRDDGSAMITIGIQTKIEEFDGGIYVHWSYPQGIQTNHSIFFKLGMKPTAPHCIKSITLLNTDKEEDW